MKIAYVYDAVYPWVAGGVQKRVWELARRLAAKHRVHWYGYQYWDGPPVVERENVTLHGVAPPKTLYHGGRRSIPQALEFSARLFRPLLDDEFDIIDCQEFPYFPILPSKVGSTINGSCLFVTWHEVWADYWYEYLGWKGVFGKGIERAVAHLPDAHIAVSRRTQQDLGALGVDRSYLVPNGISMEEFETVTPADRPIDALFIGRLIPEKGPQLFVRAISVICESIPDFQAVIVGEGPEGDAVRELISRFGLSENVTMLAFREQYQELIGLLKAADVFVLPSRREGFGITVLEALASGTPVVTIVHPQNASTELIEEGTTGVICDATPGDVATAIASASGLSRSRCTQAASRYQWDTIASSIEDIYRDEIR